MSSRYCRNFRNGRAHQMPPVRYLRRAPILLLCFLLLACAAQQDKSPAVTPTVSLGSSLAQHTIYVTTTIGASLHNDGFLVALDAETGKLRWQTNTAGTIGIPAVGNGAVYVAGDDGNVYAVNATTGQKLWTFQRTVGVSDNSGYDGYVALSGQTLYVNSDGAAVYALDAATGHQRCVFSLPLAGAHDHLYTTPSVVNGTVFVGSGAGLYALDANSGALRWKFEPNGGLGGVPVVKNNVVYVGGSGFYTVYAVDAQTGNQLWHSQAAGSVISPPAVGDGMVYIGSTDQTVYALNAQTGSLAWKYATTGNAAQPPLPTGSAVTLDGDMVYAGGQGGGFYALNAQTGKVMWSKMLDSAVDSPPTVAFGAIFVASDSGTVYTFRESDGAPGWSYHANGMIYASPALS